jgi:O-antigen biosynthesis protein WbqP
MRIFKFFKDSNSINGVKKMYKKLFKRLIDIFLSFWGIVILSLPMLVIAIAIKVDSKGPVFFKQKRVGKGKEHFNILKFRTMRTDTPHDAPTHELNDPKRWITKVGGFLRKTSLDELPQLFNIFAGSMSVIGPRPALWNQYDLIEERDKYGANDVRPGLTGWAQINGRDELEIPVKAKLDGEYIEKMSFGFDCKCFFGTITSVLKSDGVVEGGTGEIEKQKAKAEKQESEPESAASEDKDGEK